MDPCTSFTLVMARIQREEKKTFLTLKINSFLQDLRQVLYVCFHRIASVEFICDSHGQTLLSTLYKCVLTATLWFLDPWISTLRNIFRIMSIVSLII